MEMLECTLLQPTRVCVFGELLSAVKPEWSKEKQTTDHYYMNLYQS